MITSTGLDGLDKILCYLQKGDNVVWQVDTIYDYKHFVNPFVTDALRQNKRLVYMRFAEHPALIQDSDKIKTYQLDAKSGFEAFTTQVHNIISQEGIDAYYVFDCLSDLLSAWATDLMIGNFFMVTCPYLFELDTIAYFAILRNHHSVRTVARIRETTQLLLDLYDFDDNFYIHPLKVWNRYSPTMFLPHVQKGQQFLPITNSIDAAKLFSHISEAGIADPTRTFDYWDRISINAESMLEQPQDSPEVQSIIRQLCKIMIGSEPRIARLAEENFTLKDLLNIKSRLIGSGFIGGKAVGMLLAQKILLNDKSFNWEEQLEPHDSFYVGSDVFYTYIVANGWWKLRMQQKTKEGYFKVAAELREKILTGRFPHQIREQFQEMIEYFGQSPIIVRSSSLLEDSFGNAFAGKYESLFLVNQGTPDERYANFENAVRTIYASTVNEDALTYRLQRGLDQSDEQMALLIQRVSGSYRNHYFFPDLAGVGVSYNTFVWEPSLDPHAGMLRLVFGLGTRAVERVEDDYPQIIALDSPLLRAHAGKKDFSQFSQHKVDLLDITQNSLKTVPLNDLLNEENVDIKLDLLAVRDYEIEQKIKELRMKPQKAWLLTFEKLLCETDYAKKMQRILKILEEHYQYPVDVEFTSNFIDGDALKINILQCRPLQTKGFGKRFQIPEKIDCEKILFESYGYIMGGNISQPLKRIIYVEPKTYLELNLSQKYDIARLVGNLNRQLESQETTPTILLGPGRWGTTTPSLGVPVSFREINNITVMVEIAYESGNLIPELSFGTHFFQDLVESNIFYAAIFPQKPKVQFNWKILSELPNQLTKYLPDSSKYANVVKVFDIDNGRLEIVSDIITQKVVCFFA